jgi:hypothetical protein
VWCSPFFRPERGLSTAAMPPTAIPGEIYVALAKQVKAGDRHSPYVQRNKVGILQGAKSKRTVGVISKKQLGEIAVIVERAEVSDFRPVLYIIPFREVARLAKVVPPAERAHPMSIEYRIEALPKRRFDVIEIGE